jgi:hypothetical protein
MQINGTGQAWHRTDERIHLQRRTSNGVNGRPLIVLLLDNNNSREKLWRRAERSKQQTEEKTTGKRKIQ